MALFTRSPINCSRELSDFQKARVQLPPSWMRELRSKRNTVRSLIRQRLASYEYPRPIGFAGQGSFTMRTIVRGNGDVEYDLDDGIYFRGEDLVGRFGASYSALAARNMVLEAAYDERYERPAELHRNCVRIFYARGFHLDVPVYRVTTTGTGKVVEHASSVWQRSDPRLVTAWFRSASFKSPGFSTNRQLVRVVRMLKAWSSNRNWRSRPVGGFGITALVVGSYRVAPARDDLALVETLCAIRDLLTVRPTIPHPIEAGALLCDAPGNTRIRTFHEGLSQALQGLESIRSLRSRSETLSQWGRFFKEADYFERRSRFI